MTDDRVREDDLVERLPVNAHRYMRESEYYAARRRIATDLEAAREIEALRARVKEMRDLLADSEELRGKVIDVAEQWRARADAAERKLAEAYERAAMAVADEHLTGSTGTSDDIAYDTAIDHAVNAIRKLAREVKHEAD